MCANKLDVEERPDIFSIDKYTGFKFVNGSFVEMD
jgi:hypothetical protein